MQEGLEEYRILLRRLVHLQQRLIEAFESEVEVLPLPPDLPDRFRKLENIIRPEHAISQILRAWPSDVPWLPLLVWVRPRVGVLQLERDRWLFNIHGSIEVQFIGLPSGLEEAILESLRGGEMDVLLGMPGCGPTVEATYFGMGRTYGVMAWSVYEFAQSVGSKVGDLSLPDHKNLLEELVREGFLIRWPGHTPEDPYFVLAAESEATTE